MRCIDLFAGLGGFSEGATMAGCNVVWAANHWDDAVRVHASNHPETQHLCQDLHQADWSLVPQHDVLMASPACQGHTRARGKDRPHHDACRSTAWAVVSALEYHRTAVAVVENVPEFTSWTLYPAWCEALRALGYSVSDMVIDAADHGVPQNRLRVFILLARSRAKLRISLPRMEGTTAASIIDFDSGNWSAINKPGRSPATLSRIKNGRAKHGERFLTAYYGNEKGGRALNRPIGTITTRDRWAVINGNRMRMLSVPEAAKAMGFRNSYRLPSRKRDAMHMLGNAVCPPVARDILSAVQSAA